MVRARGLQRRRRRRERRVRPHALEAAARGCKDRGPQVTRIHPLDPEDATITAAMRAMLSSSKGARAGSEARGQYDALMERVLPREDVTFEEDTLGGVPGLWVLPADWRSSEAIVHLHGGWFNLGSAKAYRHLVGHISARAAGRTVIPGYQPGP